MTYFCTLKLLPPTHCDNCVGENVAFVHIEMKPFTTGKKLPTSWNLLDCILFDFLLNILTTLSSKCYRSWSSFCFVCFSLFDNCINNLLYLPLQGTQKSLDESTSINHVVFPQIIKSGIVSKFYLMPKLFRLLSFWWTVPLWVVSD